MIHILINLISDYDLQLALMERRVGDVDEPLTVEEVRGELNLRFERLSIKTSRNKEGGSVSVTFDRVIKIVNGSISSIKMTT
jgi:hypothetical protein